MNLLPVILAVVCYVTVVSSQTPKSSDTMLDSLNRASLSGRSGGNSSLSSEEKRKIREEFYREQEYKDELSRHEREQQQDSERRKLFAEQNSATPATVLVPVAPVNVQTVPVLTQRNTVPTNAQGQQTGPTRTQTSLEAMPVAVPQQQQGGMDISKILSSGVFSDFLSPKLLGPGDASSKLVPPLVTSSLQSQMQNPNQIQGQQQGMPQSQQPSYYGNGYPQYPNADPYARQMQFPGMQQPTFQQQPQNSFGLPNFGSAMPSFNGFPQQGQNFQPQSSMMQPTTMQQFPGMNNGFGTPMVQRDFPGGLGSGMGMQNPSLYGNSLIPQQGANYMG